ncbi:hypothetical protein GTZ99_03255 [Novosphingobium sp. FSY-8]|uniref:PH (Pleckstrin Homology) domain-containing protein n=1 Tax=Novosphingobium ovatum TaxID=1908523 RepID=A0ABW9XAL6_9SPHN|nr:hypothetical protein [Novosphingobium ovatum]NBC35570.1 hypothetical protein [Novosphingobium ovatum]
MPRRVILGAYLKYLVYALGCTLFVALGVHLLNEPSLHPSDRMLAWACVLMFGTATAVFTTLLARPQRLVLDQDGFTISGGLTNTVISARWAEIDRIYVWQPPSGGGFIAYALVRPTGEGKSRQTHGALPGGWPIKLEEMAALMRAYLDAHHGRAMGSAPAAIAA